MSDSILGSVADAGKDLIKEVGNQVVGNSTSAVKTAASQVTGFPTQEEELKKKQTQIATQQRIQAIQQEIRSISMQKQQLTGPEVGSSNPASIDEVNQSQKKQIDEASRQAQGRAEQGRNFKG